MANASEAESIVINGINYSVDLENKTAEVSGYMGGENITIPSSIEYQGTTYSVTSIGDYAFRYGSITSVILPNGLVSIGYGAFEFCMSLESIDIPNSVTDIKGFAFSYCMGLSNITFPNSAINIGNGAFEFTPWYFSQPDGLIYAGKIAYDLKGVNREDITSISIKDGTLGVAGGCFRICVNLTDVTIPNTVKIIGHGAFRDCRRLTTIIIPNSVTKIDYDAFEDCTSLSSVVLSDSLISIGHNAFGWCSGLTTINLPENLIELGGFQGCINLCSINFPNSLLYIRENAFCGCIALTSITIPNNVLSIGYQAFMNCSELKSIKLPNKIDTIAAATFYGCNKLNTITLSCTTPPAIMLNAFNKKHYQNTIVNVPVGYGSIYRSHLNWGEFKNINEVEMSVIKSPQIDIQQEKVDCIYNIKGELLPAKDYNQLSKGLYIVNGKKIAYGNR